jgi:glyoxylase-like metal-dependent hydrolase (beta-lactamase superfamily II)
MGALEPGGAQQRRHAANGSRPCRTGQSDGRLSPPYRRCGPTRFGRDGSSTDRRGSAPPDAGHSPGHVSVAIRSQGKEAAITGDVIHNPIQFTDPGICANFDFDQKVGLATRQAFIDNHTDREVLILGTHFPTPAVGHIVREGEGWRFTPVDADIS